MGRLILCKTENAKIPFTAEGIAVSFFTIEELCCYIETNLYLLDKNWFSEELYSWLEKELDQKELAVKMRDAYARDFNVYDCVDALITNCGYYTQQQAEQFRTVLKSIKNKTEMERRKMRADSFLKMNLYRKAAYIYMELLEKPFVEKMTDELKASITHNLGVSYANMFMFDMAASCFADAYNICDKDVYKDAYLYSLNYVPDSFNIDDKNMKIDFKVMKEVLDKFSFMVEDPDGNISRAELEKANASLTSDQARKELLLNWKAEYKKMNC